MNNNRLLKIYLVSAFVSVVLFVLSFTIGWNVLDNMRDMYALTLPFLIAAVLFLVAFGVTPETGAVRREVRRCDNVISIKSVGGCRSIDGRLKKIS